MESNNNSSWIGTARRRMIVLACIIAVVTLFWVMLLLYTNLPTIALVGIGLVCLVLLSLATAWTAMAAPSRRSGPED